MNRHTSATFRTTVALILAFLWTLPASAAITDLLPGNSQQQEDAAGTADNGEPAA